MTITAELADGRRLEFPDGTDPAVIQRTVKRLVAPKQPPLQQIDTNGQTKPERKLNENPYAGAAGIVAEPILHIASSALAKPASEVAGMAAAGYNLLTGQKNDVQGFQRDVQNALTYEPRTAAGDIVTKSPLNPVNIAGKVVHGISSGVGDASKWLADKTPLSSQSDNIKKVVDELTAQGIGIGTVKFAPQIAEGARVAADVVAKPVRGLLGSVETHAGKFLNRLGGDKRGAIIDELMNAKPSVPGEHLTAGLAATAARSPEFAGAQALIDAAKPGKYGSGGIAAGNESARLAALAKHAKTPDAIRLLEAQREAVTAPMRQNALRNIDLAAEKVPLYEGKIAGSREAVINAIQDKGRFDTTAAQQANLAKGGVVTRTAGGSGNVSPSAYPVQGQPRIPPRYTENAQRVPEAMSASAEMVNIIKARKAQLSLSEYQLKSLAEHGHYPLKTQDLVGRIDSIINAADTPTLARQVMNTVKNDIIRRSGGKDTVAASAVYRIRSELKDRVEGILNRNRLAPSQKRSAGLEIEAAKLLDDAMTQSGGRGFIDYLSEYASRSRDIDNAKTAQTLLESLRDNLDVRETPGAFAKQAAELPIKSQQLQVSMQAVQNSLARLHEFKKLAADGLGPAVKELGGELPRIPAAGPWSVRFTILKTIMNKLSDRATSGVLDYLEKHMDNPPKIAEIMQKASKNERALIDAVLDPNYLKAVAATSPTASDKNGASQ